MVYKRLKYCARGLAFPRATAQWLEVLDTPALAPVVRHQPKLFQKLQRPYLASTLHTAQRLEVLTHHYRFVQQELGPAWVREIYSTPGKCLAGLRDENGALYEIRLKSSWMDKEGELTLTLQHQATGVDLFVLTFSITHFAADRCEALIGGLQGNKQANDRDLVVGLTRHWHGLRPKSLLLFAMHQLAEIWGVTRLRAVGDTTHIYQHWRQRKAVASSYDAWWREAGGLLGVDGLFDLPVRFVPRDIATLKVNKRQMYKRRYLMLADLAGQINSSLGSPWQIPALIPKMASNDLNMELMRPIPSWGTSPN